MFNLNYFFLGDAGHSSKFYSLLPFPLSDCDKQLFGPHGEIVNPVQLPDQRQEVVCRTFINMAPRHRIAIRTLYVDLGNESNQTHFNYILVSQKTKGDDVMGTDPYPQ